jgi:hypothetical protein
VFRSYRHAPSSALAVVTQADPAARTVRKLNGERAASEYARLIGIGEHELSADVFAEHPLMVKAGGQYFSRAVQRIDEDGGLIFHSAIDKGLVLRLGRSSEIVSPLLDSLRACDEQQIGFDAVLAFESALNPLEASNRGVSAELAEIYNKNRFVGFHTYGEQFRDVHLNRNLVGLAIGRRPLC